MADLLALLDKLIALTQANTLIWEGWSGGMYALTYLERWRIVLGLSSIYVVASASPTSYAFQKDLFQLEEDGQKQEAERLAMLIMLARDKASKNGPFANLLRDLEELG